MRHYMMPPDQATNTYRNCNIANTLLAGPPRRRPVDRARRGGLRHRLIQPGRRICLQPLPVRLLIHRGPLGKWLQA